MQKKEDKSCNVIRVERGAVSITVRGTAPLLMNRMANKALTQLLLGGRKKTAGEKAKRRDPKRTGSNGLKR